MRHLLQFIFNWTESVAYLGPIVSSNDAFRDQKLSKLLQALNKELRNGNLKIGHADKPKSISRMLVFV